MTHHNDDHKNEVDDITGVETTGHEWDGIKELNNPAPRWWLWIFYITVVWSIGYWVVYPAWPTISGATKGAIGWTQYEKLAQDQAEISAVQATYMARFAGADFDTIMNDPALYEFAVAGGQAAFKDNCATCHGTGGAGGPGYPNLNDDDWLWGGSIEAIYTTLLYGIRSTHDLTRQSQMPAFLKDGLLKRDEVIQVADYVLAANKEGTAEIDHPGRAIFKEQCVSCHGNDGRGLREFGAPNLMDAIWLYGVNSSSVYKTVSQAHNREAVYQTVAQGRNSVMPHWEGRLDDHTIRQLAVYVHALGGGEESSVTNDTTILRPQPEPEPEPEPESGED